MGTTLVHLLHKYQNSEQPDFGACYVCPPVGNFVAHETTTNKHVRVLPSHWKDSWCQGGTRKNEKSGHYSHRWLCYYTTEGPPKWICEGQPTNDTRQWWRTQAPDDFPREGLGVQYWHFSEHLMERGGARSLCVKLQTNSEELVAFQVVQVNYGSSSSTTPSPENALPP